MRGLEQHYAFLLAELPSRNFNRYSVLVDKFEALVSSKVFLEWDSVSLTCCVACVCVCVCACVCVYICVCVCMSVRL